MKEQLAIARQTIKYSSQASVWAHNAPGFNFNVFKQPHSLLKKIKRTSFRPIWRCRCWWWRS